MAMSVQDGHGPVSVSFLLLFLPLLSSSVHSLPPSVCPASVLDCQRPTAAPSSVLSPVALRVAPSPCSSHIHQRRTQAPSDCIPWWHPLPSPSTTLASPIHLFLPLHRIPFRSSFFALPHYPPDQFIACSHHKICSHWPGKGPRRPRVSRMVSS